VERFLVALRRRHQELAPERWEILPAWLKMRAVPNGDALYILRAKFGNDAGDRRRHAEHEARSAAVERNGTPGKHERFTHEFVGDLSRESRVQNHLSSTTRAGIFRRAPPVGISKVHIHQQEWCARSALPRCCTQAAPQASILIDDCQANLLPIGTRKLSQQLETSLVQRMHPAESLGTLPREF